MTEDPIELLPELKAAELLFNIMGVQNVTGITLKEQVEMDVRYELARRRLEKARTAYADAIRRQADTKSDTKDN